MSSVRAISGGHAGDTYTVALGHASLRLSGTTGASRLIAAAARTPARTLRPCTAADVNRLTDLAESPRFVLQNSSTTLCGCPERISKRYDCCPVIVSGGPKLAKSAPKSEGCASSRSMRLHRERRRLSHAPPRRDLNASTTISQFSGMLQFGHDRTTARQELASCNLPRTGNATRARRVMQADGRTSRKKRIIQKLSVTYGGRSNADGVNNCVGTGVRCSRESCRSAKPAVAALRRQLK